MTPNPIDARVAELRAFAAGMRENRDWLYLQPKHRDLLVTALPEALDALEAEVVRLRADLTTLMLAAEKFLVEAHTTSVHVPLRSRRELAVALANLRQTPSDAPTK